MNIVVTGCSQGIGYEIANILIENKANHVIGIARNAEILKQIENKANNNFTGIPFDLSTIFRNHEQLLEKIKYRFEHIDVLINNAGMLINKPFGEYSYDEIEQLFYINLFAPAELIHILIPFMGGKSRTHIVNIGSMGGYQGSSKYNGLSWYSSSKAAIANLSESLAEEFKELNIDVNCLALGAVNSEMLSVAFPGYKAPVNPDEVGKFIADFALTGNKLFNGRIIPVALSNP